MKQKKCHIYVLIFVHCASKSASSTLFYHPRCKNRKPKICFLFFCFKWGQTQRHIYVLIFVHCASKSASSTLFYPTRCKNRKPKICFLFFCFKWSKKKCHGQLVAVYFGSVVCRRLVFGVYTALSDLTIAPPFITLIAADFGLARWQILCYDYSMFNLKDKFYVCGD